MKTLLRPVFGLVLVFCAWSSAYAVPCADTRTGVFTGPLSGINPTGSPLACQDGATSNPPETILAGFFGIDWTFGDKAGPEDATNTSFWSGDFVGPEGQFTLAADFWTRFAGAIVVLKGGKTASGHHWSAYRLIDGISLYSWVYGYNSNHKRKDISHINIYTIDRPVTVPEPASLGLLGLGLVLLGAARRRLSR